MTLIYSRPLPTVTIFCLLTYCRAVLTFTILLTVVKLSCADIHYSVHCLTAELCWYSHYSAHWLTAELCCYSHYSAHWLTAELYWQSLYICYSSFQIILRLIKIVICVVWHIYIYLCNPCLKFCWVLIHLLVYFIYSSYLKITCLLYLNA